MAEKIIITLKRSTIARKPDQRATVRSLGLRKINSSVIQEASSSILGMVEKVRHLVEVKPYDASKEQKI